MTGIEKYQWSRLNRLQVGRYAEHFVTMEFILYGCDVFRAEVDDRGIDLVVRSQEDRHYDVQVKSVRQSGYIFFPKATFHLRPNLYAAIVIFTNGELPMVYLVPSTRWLYSDGLFVSRDYEGKQSAPEWGLNLSKVNLPLLDEFAFDHVIHQL